MGTVDANTCAEPYAEKPFGEEGDLARFTAGNGISEVDLNELIDSRSEGVWIGE